MAGPKGYSSYRGKAPKGKIFLAVFLVLVILVAVAFIRLQKYIVYDDSGRPRLELPKPAEDPASSAASGSGADGNVLPDLTIQEPERVALRAATLPLGPLTDWTAASDALSALADVNAVVYTVKDPEGNVYLDSDTALPAARRSAEGTAALTAMTGGEFYTVARLSCFRDAAAASGALEDMGLKNTGGYVFYDGNNDRWLDPAKPAARQYLIGLARECAALGFDELLLTDLSYPTVGKLNKIDYSGATGAALRQANLTQFLTELQAALSDTGVKLSLELPSQVILGDKPDLSAASGQSLPALAPLVDRVCAVMDGPAAEDLAKAVSAASASTAFLPEQGAAPGAAEYLDPAPLVLPGPAA